MNKIKASTEFMNARPNPLTITLFASSLINFSYLSIAFCLVMEYLFIHLLGCGIYN